MLLFLPVYFDNWLPQISILNKNCVTQSLWNYLRSRAQHSGDRCRQDVVRPSRPQPAEEALHNYIPGWSRAPATTPKAWQESYAARAPAANQRGACHALCPGSHLYPGSHHSTNYQSAEGLTYSTCSNGTTPPTPPKSCSLLCSRSICAARAALLRDPEFCSVLSISYAHPALLLLCSMRFTLCFFSLACVSLTC